MILAYFGTIFLVFGPLATEILPKIAGVLPPVLCAPFDDPDDFDDIAAGVPMLHGLRRRHVKR